METEIKTEGEVIDTTNDTGEGETGSDKIAISKSDYEKMNQTLGSLKRELKDLRKSKDDSKETSTTNQKSDDSRVLERLEKSILKGANITHDEDIALAKSTAKKWGVDLEDVLSDEDFKVKLEKQQTKRDNAIASSGIKGGGSESQAKLSPEYWIAKGTPPSPSDIPDRKIRAKIVRSMMSNAQVGKKFYND